MIINIYNNHHEIKLDTDMEVPQQYSELIKKIEALNLSQNEINVSIPYADVHTHGAMGYDFSDCTYEEMKKIDKFYLDNGIGYVLPTLVALNPEMYEKQISSIVKIIKEGNTSFIGINLEGPFINPAKKGAINEKDIRSINIEFAKKLWELSEGYLKIMTVAPELENFDELADFAKDKFTISLGHTASDYETALKAIQHENARHITHLFNAMNSIHHRKPSLLGAALENFCYKEAICDGVHLNEGIIRMLFNRMNEEIVLISDSVSACGLSDGIYKLGGLDVHVKDQHATLSDGTIAGSCKSIAMQAEFCVKIGVPKEKLLLSSTYTPFKSMNMEVPDLLLSDKINIFNNNLKLITKIGY